MTSRAKSVESLKRSLWRDRRDWEPEQFETALAPPLIDLAGVRILLYQDVDVAPAADALRHHFSITRDKDKRSTDSYSAHHMVICDWCSEDDVDEPLRHLPCEIQICTIVEHVWNELEHDIKYKQPQGRPDHGQDELLISLRAELDLCARTAGRLMLRTAARAKQNEEQMEGSQDLRRYLEGRFVKRVDGPFEELWDFLNRLMANITPRALDAVFEQGHALTVATSLRDKLDVDHAHREVGLAVVMLLPSFPLQDVQEVISSNSSRPLWKFMGRVLSEQAGGTQ